MPPIGSGAAESHRHARHLVVALFLVAVLAGSALFSAGFTLGIQQSLAPGHGASAQGLFDPFWEAYDKIRTDYVGAYDPKQLVEGAIKGMFGALADPFSSYMTPEEYHDSMAQVEWRVRGHRCHDGRQGRLPGRTARRSVRPASLVVRSVIPGSPAEHGRAPRRRPADGRGRRLGGRLHGRRHRGSGSRAARHQGASCRCVRGGEPMELTITRDVIQSSAVVGAARSQTARSATCASTASAAARRTTSEPGCRPSSTRASGSSCSTFVTTPAASWTRRLSIASQFVATGPIYWEEHADGHQGAVTTRSRRHRDRPGHRGRGAREQRLGVRQRDPDGRAPGHRPSHDRRARPRTARAPSSSGISCRATRAASGCPSPSG